MMKHEFETIAGYSVTEDDYYNIIEPMYMSLETVTKYEFVKLLDKKRFSKEYKREQYIKALKKAGKAMFEKCGRVETVKEENEINNICYQ